MTTIETINYKDHTIEIWRDKKYGFTVKETGESRNGFDSTEDLLNYAILYVL